MSGLLSSVLGQTAAVETLRRSLASGRVHHAYLFDGPDGVGKERAAWGLAQALVCERRPVHGADACGECNACLRATPRAGERSARHPDVIVLERGLYDPATIGRKSPETQDISIDQVRTLVLARSAFPPYEGRAKVFLFRRAEELSITAANALLKTLEEPGDRTHFVLLSSASDTLLPTVRSRSQRVRFGHLPEEIIRRLLVERGVEAERAAAIAPLASGSMAQALVLSDPEASEERNRFVSAALEAIDARDMGAALDVAEHAKKVHKDALLSMMRSLALALGERGARAAREGGRAADVAAARYSLSLATALEIEGNASVQLALESLFIKLRAI